MTDQLVNSGVIIAVLGVVGIWVREYFAHKKRKKNGRVVGNPISIDAFYQAFKDFKEHQCKWNEKREEDIEKLEDRMRHLEKGR